MKIVKRVLAVVLTVLMIVSFVSVLPVAAQEEDTLNRANWDDKMMLHVENDYLVNGYGEKVRLAGVNVPTLNCVLTGDNFWDNFYLAIEDWQCNLLRINLDARWMPDMPEGSEAGWKTHVAIIDKVVSEAVRYGVYVDLDDHPSGLPWLPDDSDFRFWQFLAKRYGNCPNVVFGLFNEPHSCDWDQWKYGSRGKKIQNPNSPGDQPRVWHGMQELVNEIRACGAKNVIFATGRNSGNIFEGLVEEALLTDPSGYGIAYEIHRYAYGDDYENRYDCVLGKVPLYIGEFNANNGPYNYYTAIQPWDLQDDDSIAYMKQIMNFIDKWDMNFTAWSLHTNFPPALLDTASPSFQPSASGQIVKDYIAKCCLYKNVSFFTDDGDDLPVAALNFGSYTAADLSRHGVDLSKINKLYIKQTNYRYYTTLYSGDKCNGQSMRFYGTVNDLKAAGLNFVPKSLKIERIQPDNLLPSSRVTVTSGEEYKQKLTDGTQAMWKTDEDGEQTILFDLKDTYLVDEIKLFHAASAEGYYGYYNTSDFRISVSSDGKIYTSVMDVYNNRNNVTDCWFDTQPCRYIKIVITKGNRMEIPDCMIMEAKAFGIRNTGVAPRSLFPIKSAVIDLNDGDNIDQVIDDYFEPDLDEDETGEGTVSDPQKKIIRRKKITYPAMGLPVWAWILIIAGGIVVLAGAALATVLLLRRRKAVLAASADENEQTGEDGHRHEA